MGMPVTRMQSRFTRVVGAATMVVAVVGLGALAWGGTLDDRLALAVVVALIGLIGYAAMWAPYVEMRDDGVELRNVTATVLVPWASIEEIDGRYGMALRTPHGTVTSWAASAPAGRARGRVQMGPEATAVAKQLERQRALAGPGEAAAPTTRRHPEVVGGAVVLLVLLAGALLLG